MIGKPLSRNGTGERERWDANLRKGHSARGFVVSGLVAVPGVAVLNGSIDSTPEVVCLAVLDRIKRSGSFVGVRISTTRTIGQV